MVDIMLVLGAILISAIKSHYWIKGMWNNFNGGRQYQQQRRSVTLTHACHSHKKAFILSKEQMVLPNQPMPHNSH